MFYILKTTLNLPFTKMHSTQHHCFLGKSVRNVETSKSQFGQKAMLTTNATTHASISTYKQISEIYFKDTWEMVYCNCMQGLKILCLYVF